jgi:hypothetical protein
MIELPSRAERDYLGGFGIAAIRIDPVGQASIASPVQLARVPAAAVLWARDRCAANEIVTGLGDYRATGVDNAIHEVEAAALRLGVVLSPHAVVMRRAKAATAEITTRLDAAQRAGLLRFVNREYRVRRLAAHAAGQKFMSYGQMQRRLRKALAGAAATGSMPEIVAIVFGPCA